MFAKCLCRQAHVFYRMRSRAFSKPVSDIWHKNQKTAPGFHNPNLILSHHTHTHKPTAEDACIIYLCHRHRRRTTRRGGKGSGNKRGTEGSKASSIQGHSLPPIKYQSSQLVRNLTNYGFFLFLSLLRHRLEISQISFPPAVLSLGTTTTAHSQLARDFRRRS